MEESLSTLTLTHLTCFVFSLKKIKTVCLYEMFLISLHTLKRSAFLQACPSLTDVDFTRSRQKRASRVTERSDLAEPAACWEDTLKTGSQVSLSREYPGLSREGSHFLLSPLPTATSTCVLCLSPSLSSCTNPAPSCGPDPGLFCKVSPSLPSHFLPSP